MKKSSGNLIQLAKRKEKEIKEHKQINYQREVLGKENTPISWQDFRGDFT